jgi:hypothetical protein
MSEDFHRERKVPHVGTYRRELPVSVERLYENAIDWEHLPYLHRNSFAHIEYADAGVWGFRTRVWPQPYDERRSVLIELKLDRELRRWITSTLDGPGTGTEVWTHAFSLAERQTLVGVDFFVPGCRRCIQTSGRLGLQDRRSDGRQGLGRSMRWGAGPIRPHLVHRDAAEERIALNWRLQ